MCVCIYIYMYIYIYIHNIINHSFPLPRASEQHQGAAASPGLLKTVTLLSRRSAAQREACESWEWAWDVYSNISIPAISQNIIVYIHSKLI